MIKKDLRPTSSWHSARFTCFPPTQNASNFLDEKGHLKTDFFNESFCSLIENLFFEEFFRFRDGQPLFCIPILLMTPCPSDFLKPFLFNLAKKLLYPSFLSAQWKNAVIFIDFKDSTEPLEIVRELQNQCAIESDQERKVVFLYNVNDLSQNAKDALLKFLEEPRTEIQVILVTPHFRNLGDTFLSRCLKAHIILEKKKWIDWISQSTDYAFDDRYVLGCINACQNDPIFLLNQINSSSFEEYNFFSRKVLEAYDQKNVSSLLKLFLPPSDKNLKMLFWYEDLLSELAFKKMSMPNDLSFKIIDECLKLTERSLSILIKSPHVNVELLLMSLFIQQTKALQSRPTD